MVKFILSFLKVILSIVLLPVSVAASLTLYTHLNTYPAILSVNFIYGAVFFVLVFLFLYQFWGFFELGYKVLTNLFQFAAPMDKWLAYGTPIYTVLVLLIFYIVRVLGKVDSLDQPFSFLAGFTLAMHVLVLAQELQNQEKALLKPDYLLAMNLIYILDIFLVILLMDLVFQKWTFPLFFESFAAEVSRLFQLVIGQF